MRRFLAAAALLLALAPGAALAHGDEGLAAAESAPKVFAHPSCPGGGGECCCRAVLGTGLQPPAVLSPARTFIDAGRSGRHRLPARDAVYARPLHSPLLSRAPPVVP
jgi:hypothetical protein